MRRCRCRGCTSGLCCVSYSLVFCCREEPHGAGAASGGVCGSCSSGPGLSGPGETRGRSLSAAGPRGQSLKMASDSMWCGRGCWW
ncbi:unnamed protein product [Knipowitschia caucasica]